MITKFALADELASSMEQELKPFEEKQVPQNLAQAVECLHAAAEIFEEAGLTKKADQVLDILFKFAQNKKMHTNMISKLPPVAQMMEKGITLNDFEKMNKGDVRAKAKINRVLYDLGLSNSDIIQILGPDNFMKQHDSSAFSNPHSSSSAILKMIEEDLKPNEDSESIEEFNIKSIAAKHKKPRKISDPHTEGLTSEKMVENLLHHGTEFNMDDDSADDLLNLDINYADLEVLENDVISAMDFEDEV